MKDFNIDMIRALTAEEARQMAIETMEIKDDVKSLKIKPLKRWDSIVNTVLIALVTAIAGFLLARLGL